MRKSFTLLQNLQSIVYRTFQSALPWLMGALSITACSGPSEAPALVDGGPDSTGGQSDAADAHVDVPDPLKPDAIPQAVCAADAGPATDLACTGLYKDWPTRVVADDVREFKPAHELWSDGAKKRRWIWLPPGKNIDVTDLNEWVFPIGTKLWKQFSLPINGIERPIETRFFEKTSADNWRKTLFLWSPDGSVAKEHTSGVPSVLGTDGYEVPPTSLCAKCHAGRADNVLGFDAVQLAGAGATGLTWQALQQANLLTSSGTQHQVSASNLKIPGNAVEEKALGWLHANCGVACHNNNLAGSHFNARIDIANNMTPSLFQTGVYQTTINQLSTFRPKDATLENYYRVRPRDVAHSTIAYRIKQRDNQSFETTEQMPPVATHRVDQAGVDTIEAWIGAMTPDAGYPEPATLDSGKLPPDGSVSDSILPPMDALPADVKQDTVPDQTVQDAKADVVDTAPDAVADQAIDQSVPPVSDAGPSCSLTPMKLAPIVTSGLSNPVYVTSPPQDNSRLFVVEKGGTVRLVKSGVLQSTPFITVSDVYVPSSNAEGGLLGLAFHPNYASNRLFYLHYTATPNGNVVVREFRRSSSNEDIADSSPVRTLLQNSHGGWNHCGGMLAFGKDGHLYAAVGDAAQSPTPARNLSNPLGKILRFDVANHPTAPAGNMTGTNVNPYIWSYGLRNPWRFSFDRLTGEMYIGDVGQSTYEEINVEPSGVGKRDYGWNLMEGMHCFPIGSSCTPTGTLPVVEHSHGSGEAGSIIGGFVYRGNANPCLRGRYVYADYVTARIFSFVWNGSSVSQRQELTSDLNAGSTASRIVSFGEDASGELYLVNIFPGRIYRIDPE